MSLLTKPNLEPLYEYFRLYFIFFETLSQVPQQTGLPTPQQSLLSASQQSVVTSPQNASPDYNEILDFSPERPLKRVKYAGYSFRDLFDEDDLQAIKELFELCEETDAFEPFL